MRAYIEKAASLVKTQTAKDTLIVFVGNIFSAFLGFFFILFVARGLSVEEFGVFSAANNLIVIISSFTDLGIATGMVTFVASHLAKGKSLEADKYYKASFIIKLTATFILVVILVFFAPFMARKFLATDDPKVSLWVGGISLGFFFYNFFPRAFDAQKKFFHSAMMDLSFMIPRATIAFVFLYLGMMTLTNSFLSFAIAGLFVTVIGFIVFGISFLKAKAGKKTYSKLFKYSGWLGVNRLVSSISGRLDVAMLAAMLGASETGVYGIASRLASFIIVLASSFTSVLAPRMAGFNNKEKEKIYMLKATLALVPIALGIVLWVAIADPFVTILFGIKYREAVPVFQILALAMIPFLFTAPSVSAITYAMKKTVYIGVFSFFQVACIFLLNYYLIPKYGVIGPTITFAIANTSLLIYTWIVVIRHYWVNKI